MNHIPSNTSSLRKPFLGIATSLGLLLASGCGSDPEICPASVTPEVIELTEASANEGSFDEIASFKAIASEGRIYFLGFLADGTEALATDAQLSKDDLMKVPTLAVGEKLTEGYHYTVANMPSGLSAEVTLTGINGEVDIELSGNAESHATSNNVNVVFTLTRALVFSPVITTEPATMNKTLTYAASDQAYPISRTLSLKFADAPTEPTPTPTATATPTPTATPVPTPTLDYSATLFLEDVTTNDGAIDTTIDITLSNDTWSIGGGTFTLTTHYTITGVPTGLTAVLTWLDANTARLSFTGNATSNDDSDDVTGVTFAFEDAAFTSGTKPSDGTATEDLAFDFIDADILLYSAGSFTGNLGGRSGADALCDAAKPTGYRTNARAFISVNDLDEIRDMPINYSIPPDQAVKTEAGTLLASTWSGLLDGDIDATLAAGGIMVDPMSGNPPHWWSGSDNSGALNTSHCVNWTSNDFMDDGAVGTLIESTNWILSDLTPQQSCDTPAELLCVAFQIP